MKVFESRCVGCTDLGIPCIGLACPNKKVEVHYCDNPRCGCELDEIYEADGSEYCEECYYELLPDEPVLEDVFTSIKDIMLGKRRRRNIYEPEAI